MRLGLSIFRSALGRLANLALPQDCLLCGARAGDALLCPACRAELPTLPAEHCPLCALPTLGATLCGRCLKRPPHFDATVAPFAYAFPIDRLIQGLKYGHRLAIVPFLGQALAATGRLQADLVVPLPLHPFRLRERGFNQALEIARAVALDWQLPLDYRACERSHNAPPQASLPWKERQRNVRGAFLCRHDLTGKHVVAVDDVMTSGATLDEFARSLKKAGAVRVTSLVVARTLKTVSRS
ncbi:MAG: ComF family protein [Rhodocyclaceae bacterium]